jgi:hypothetical protein
VAGRAAPRPRATSCDYFTPSRKLKDSTATR